MKSIRTQIVRMLFFFFFTDKKMWFADLFLTHGLYGLVGEGNLHTFDHTIWCSVLLYDNDLRNNTNGKL